MGSITKLKVTDYSRVVLPDSECSVNEYVFELKKSKQNNAGIKFDIVSVKKGYVILNLYENLPKGYKLYVFQDEPVTLDYELDGVFKRYKFELTWVNEK